MIRSVCSSNREALDAIKNLHLPEGYECDVTFGNGSFWNGSGRPGLCFDLTPLEEGVRQACSSNLPLESESLNNMVFDPPFMTYIRSGRGHKNGAMALSKRFGGYYTYGELEDHYKATIAEAGRVLKPSGKLIFKCQDIIHNHRMHCTHVNVCNWAQEMGFRLLDLFVLAAKSRMPGPQKGQQRHARIFHSYFLVLLKQSQRRSRAPGIQQ